MKVKSHPRNLAADVRFLRPELTRWNWNIEQIFLWHAPQLEECLITSGNDGRHMKGSKHYENKAEDIRTWYPSSGRTYLDDVASRRNPEMSAADAITMDLEAFDMTQVNDILKRLTDGERDGLIIRAGVTSGEGAILSYLTDVDNTTNDSSYQAGFRFAF